MRDRISALVRISGGSFREVCLVAMLSEFEEHLAILADAGTASTLFGIEGDARFVAHGEDYTPRDSHSHAFTTKRDSIWPSACPQTET